VPSKVVVAPAIVTLIPVTNPCEAEVVNVAIPDVNALFVSETLPIAPLFEVASKVTATPLGVPLTRVLAAEVPVAFVAVAPNW